MVVLPEHKVEANPFFTCLCVSLLATYKSPQRDILRWGFSKAQMAASGIHPLPNAPCPFPVLPTNPALPLQDMPLLPTRLGSHSPESVAMGLCSSNSIGGNAHHTLLLNVGDRRTLVLLLQKAHRTGLLVHTFQKEYLSCSGQHSHAYIFLHFSKYLSVIFSHSAKG